MKEEDLENALPRNGETGGIGTGNGKNLFVLLAPPGNRPIVCLLGAYWDLSGDSTQMSLYLHLFGQSQSRDIKTWHRGYRLELGHRRGNHGYTHVQPLKTQVWPQRKSIPFVDKDIPDKFPAFPLRGKHMTTLCAALAISLNGTNLGPVLNALKDNPMLGDVQSLLE